MRQDDRIEGDEADRQPSDVTDPGTQETDLEEPAQLDTSPAPVSTG
jgi:hypothetical protein